MPRDTTGSAMNDLARTQLIMFHALGDEISLSSDERRRALNLDDRTWEQWMEFLLDGPLPARPAVPEMLLRLSETAFHLSAAADRHA